MRKLIPASTTLFIIILISANALKAQDTISVSDLETWSSISVEKKLFNKNLSLNISQEFRINNNSTNLDVYYTKAAINYKIIKNLQVGIGYRFIKDKKNDVFINKQRINFDLGYKYKINRVKLSSRLKYQRKSEIKPENIENSFPVKKYRLKLGGNYNIKKCKFTPFISFEIFYAKGEDTDVYIDKIYESKGFQKIRFTLGTSYSIKNFGSIKLFYRIEQEFKTYSSNINNLPERYYILGLNYKFTF